MNYDVVVDVLTKHRDKLWEITNRNMNSEFIGMGIMDDIRLEQIEQINEAIKIWNIHVGAKHMDDKGYQEASLENEEFKEIQARHHALWDSK